MMSWIGFNVNPKYDPYRAIRLRSLLESDNIFQVRKTFDQLLSNVNEQVFDDFSMLYSYIA